MKRSAADYANIERLYATGLSTATVSAQLGIPNITIVEHLRRHGLTRRSGETRELNPVGKRTLPATFSFRPLQAKTAYLLGLIYGDGSLDKQGNSVRVCTGDWDVIEAVQRICGGPLSVGLSGPNCHVAGLNSRRIWRELHEDYGLVANKCHRLVFPKFPDELMPHFVRGLLDSDGCWGSKPSPTKTYLMFAYVSICREFVEDLRTCLIRLAGVSPDVHMHAPAMATGGYLKGRRIGSRRQSYKVSYSHRDSIRIGEWLYAGSEGMRCERKFRTWDEVRQLVMATRTPEDFAEIAAKYEAGYSTMELAKMYRLDNSSISKRLRSMGVTMRSKNSGGFRRTTREQREAIVRRYRAHEPATALAREYGYSYRGLSRLLRRLGVPSHRSVSP